MSNLKQLKTALPLATWIISPIVAVANFAAYRVAAYNFDVNVYRHSVDYAQNAMHTPLIGAAVFGVIFLGLTGFVVYPKNRKKLLKRNTTPKLSPEFTDVYNQVLMGSKMEMKTVLDAFVKNRKTIHFLLEQSTTPQVHCDVLDIVNRAEGTLTALSTKALVHLRANNETGFEKVLYQMSKVEFSVGEITLGLADLIAEESSADVGRIEAFVSGPLASQLLEINTWKELEGL